MPLALVPESEFRWPSGANFCVGSLGLRVEELARRVGTTVQHWDEDGLGPSSGFGGRLPSGRLVAFIERAHAIEQHAWRGPDVWADLADVAQAGTAAIRAEVVATLELPVSAFDFEMPTSADHAAVEARARLQQQRSNRAT